MKKHIFDKYVTVVAERMGLNEADIFDRQVADSVKARHWLYLLCFQRNMGIMEIQKYMAQSGFAVYHSNIIYSNKTVLKSLKKDPDLKQIFNELKHAI